MSKGLVQRLAKQNLDQREEIENLFHNVAVLQEVIEKQQTQINRKQAKINMLKAQLENSKKEFEGLDPETVESFEDICNIINSIFDKLEIDEELQKDFIIKGMKLNLHEIFN